MPDIRSLTLQLEQRLEPPVFDDLVEVAARRRRARRSFVGVLSLVVAVAVALSTFGPGRPATLPAAPSAHDQQVADIFRNPRGSLVLETEAPGEPSVTAELWTRCNGTSPATSGRCGSAVQVVAHDLTRTWVLPSNGYVRLDFLSDGRFYLEGADGRAQVLDPRLPDPVDLRDLRSHAFVRPRPGLTTTRCLGGLLCVVDLARRTVAPLDVDNQHWSADRGSVLWGYADTFTDPNGVDFSYEARWVEPDGSRGRHVLATREPVRVVMCDVSTADTLAYYVVPVGWEGSDPSLAASTWTHGTLHVSTDRGAGWSVRQVPVTAVGEVADSRLAEDWPSWPQVRP